MYKYVRRIILVIIVLISDAESVCDINEREFDVRKVLKKLWEWNIFSNFIGDNQRVTNKHPFP